MKNHSNTQRTILRTILLLAALMPGAVWGQTGTDCSGIYYFVNGGSGKTDLGDPVLANVSNPDDYFYLVPADNPQQTNKRDAWYSSDYSTTNGDPEKPYLTTYRTNKDVAAIPDGVTNRPHNSVWIVQFASTDGGTDYYYLIHAATGKYVVYEPPYSNKNNRKSVHLLTTDSPGENAKFAITISSGNYNFRPKSLTSGNKFLNVANANYNYYYSSDGSADGDANYFRGLVGLWSVVGGGSDWQKEATLLDAPTISDVDANNRVTIADANSLPSGYKIRYTTDGSVPTASTGTEYSGAIPITESVTINAVVVRYGMVLTEVASETREPAPCAKPVISFDYTNSMVSITCATDNTTIYYTTNGDTPTTNSTEYSSSFLVTSTTAVKAIATHATWEVSDVAELTISQVATPTIQNNGSNAISITTTTPGATIYYTTDGTTPSTSSSEYTGPLTDNVSNVTIKAIAVKENMITSAVNSGSVKLQCATPVIARDGMTFTLSCSKPTDAALYYTLGSGSEVAYTGTPVSFISDQLPMTVTAVARHNDYTVSETASMEFINGSGTSNDPYLIYGTTDYANFVANVNNGATAAAYYKLETDVSANGIGVITTAFTGNFDGGMHTISNLGHALFDVIDGGTVKNLVLDNVTISGGTNVGAICNEATGDSRIYNCGVLATSSTVTTDDDGYTKITSCSSTVGGSNYVGGLVGLLDGTSRVINCFSYANITSGAEVGGIVGHNNVATTSNNLKTMVMNCMFYGDIDTNNCTSKAPIYNGEIITNDGSANGVGNYNYFWSGATYVQDRKIDVYHCALGAETRFLQRFEFFRHLLNSHRELAGWWATGTYSKSEMMKWVLLPDNIGSTTPYPILKKWGKYPSVVNIDAEHAATGKPRNKGGKLGTLSVTIQMDDENDASVPYHHPNGATLNKTGLTLNITDKDTAHYNFNYYKVQLPYYNEVGTKNYNGNRVVTGWKIVSITGGTAGTYSTGEDVTYTDGVLTATPYNFADRNCTDKDLYSVSGRVFNQGAYWDVPYGVTAITIEPYWAKCVYLSDAYADVVYNQAMTSATNVPDVGGGQKYTNRNSYSIAGENQRVFTSKGDAIATSNNGLFVGASGSSDHTVYDYAVVLVGNYHFYGSLDADMSKPYTVTSIDLDGDNEPDYSYILRFDSRRAVHPVRVDFINIPGLGMAQKSTGGTGTYNFGIMQPKGWFESTNTSLFRETQFEYDNDARVAAPYILQGGVMEQWVNGQSGGHHNLTTYFHVGGNVWFKEFHRGTHQDQTYDANHSPVSVTGGDFDQFHLTGLYRADAAICDDNAECYITGGRFRVVAGTGMDGLGTTDGKGNITWIIDNADIKEFYAGSFNADKSAIGNLHTIVNGGHIDLFCGGPKFGDMSPDKTVTTTATGCTFGTFFGAGYGGNSYSRQAPRNHSGITNFPHTDNQNPPGYDKSWNSWLQKYYKQEYNSTYGGVSTQFSYQFIPESGNAKNVARIFVEYVKFSLATTHGVTSNLKHCTIENNFYGGGSLGKVDGPVISTLDSCTVNGNVYGAGFSASLPTVEVDSIGFRTEPYYYEALGTYRTGVKGRTTTYTWRDTNVTVSSTATAVDNEKHFLYTNEDLKALGTVEGNVTLTLKGNTKVGTLLNENTPSESLKQGTGNVFGGGDMSGVIGGGNTTVILEEGAHVLGNVYGGGNKGPVGGNSSVTLQ